MTPDQAADLAARILAAPPGTVSEDRYAADRERVESDLAGLRECWHWRHGNLWPTIEHHATRYAEGLRRTAALYGVTA